MKITLEVIEGPDGGATFRMEPGGSCTVGRSARRADFVLAADPYISRQHCLLEHRDGQLLLSNLSRTNHIFVNNNVMTRRKRIRDRDIIRIGFTRIRLRLDEAAGEQAGSGISARGPDIRRLLSRPPVCCVCGNPLFTGDVPAEPGELPVFCHAKCLPEPDTEHELPDLGAENTVLGRLGHGEMCLVYLVARPVPGHGCYRLHAVRRLTKSAGTQIGKRFRHGYESLRQVRHPNVVATHDLQVIDGLPHIFLECALAGTLHDLILHSARPLLPDAAVAVTRQILEGLRAMHENSPPLYHRDIKPQNILVRAPGRAEYALEPVVWEKENFLAQLADFDMVKRDSASGMLTGTAWAMGTYEFASPESIRDAKRVTAASDLYSVGATLYYLLTGRLPYNYPSALEIERFYLENAGQLADRYEAYKVWGEQHHCPPRSDIPCHVPVIPLQPEKDNIPARLCQVVNRLLEKEPDKRFQNAAQVLEALV